VNSRSLADFVLGFNVEGDDEISLEKWVPPTLTPPDDSGDEPLTDNSQWLLLLKPASHF
jgi:hypothetical protein